MRVLMVVPKYPYPVIGGVERQAHALSIALMERGHTIQALSGRFDPSQKAVDSIDGIRVHRIRWSELRLLRFIFFPLRLARVIVKLRKEVDLIHIHNISWFGGFVSLFARLAGLPVITKLPNIGEFGIPAMRRRASGALLIRLLLRCDAIIAMTQESVKELTDIGYPLSRILKVTNGIAPLPAALPDRTSPETVNAIFVGRLSWEKGVADLLHAWAVVKDRASRPVNLRLLGDGPMYDELRSLASELELDDTVDFLGFCEHVTEELGKSHLFVLGSYAEGNSNSILEAMRAGLPIVATDVGGTSIQVGKDGRRFLIAPGDREGLAGRLLELIEDEALRLRAGAAMRERIETVFDIDRVAATYEQAYELILRGHQEQIGALNPALFASGESVRLECAE